MQLSFRDHAIMQPVKYKILTQTHLGGSRGGGGGGGGGGGRDAGN